LILERMSALSWSSWSWLMKLSAAGNGKECEKAKAVQRMHPKKQFLDLWGHQRVSWLSCPEEGQLLCYPQQRIFVPGSAFWCHVCLLTHQ
jgi:hypothetical protein